MTKNFIPTRLLRTVLATCTMLLLLTPSSAQALTQRDWMVAMVDSLGRSFGLPDEPQLDNYLDILKGTRHLRLEAETTHAKGDEVSTLAFLNYGPFSGPGWLLGTMSPSEVHLRFILPLNGRYRVGAALYRPGHTIRIGEQHFTADGGELHFTQVDVGEAFLTAGPQEIVVTLPPGGAIDYLELTAPNLPAIAPDGGWRPEAPLTWETLAVTAVQALNLGSSLPLTGQPLAFEAETLTENGGARVVEDAHLGQPSGGRWLRTAAQPATIRVPLTIAQGGFYDVELTATGNQIDALINTRLLRIEGRPYLEAVTLPPVFLPKGPNQLEITLPPGGGLDRIVLRARQSSLPALATALELTVTGDVPVSAVLDRLSTRLATATR